MSTELIGAQLMGALRAMLGELVGQAVVEAVDELRSAEPLRPVLLSREQLAQALGISTATLHRLVRAGCPCVWVGDTRRYQLDAVLTGLESRKAA